MSISAPGEMFPNKDKTMIIVTGGFGFIGSNLVQYLNRLGIVDIIVVDDLTMGEKFHHLKDYHIKDYYDVDNFFQRELSRPLLWRKVRHIYHLGAISSTTAGNGKEVMKYNYEFSRDLYNEARANKIGFTFLSSASVYGNTVGECSGFDEGYSIDPLNLYAYSKVMFENYLLDTGMEKTQVFRPFNVYGPNEEHKGHQASPITKFKKEVDDTGVIHIFEGSDKIYRDFICVDDVVKIIATFPKDKTGIYNLGTGNVESFQRVAELIAEKYDGVVQTVPFPSNLKEQYQYFTKAHTTKLIKALEHDYRFITVEDYIKHRV